MTLFWKILGGLAALLLLVVIVAGITIRTFDANDLIGPIQQHVKDATGRELTIRGGAELKLALEPKLIISDVVLGNAAWGKSPQMLTAKRIEAEVALLPLLRRRVEVVRFGLIEPQISLETDAAGNGNWEIAGAGAAAAAKGESRPFNGLAIGDLAITNGTISYRDGSSGKVTNVSIDTLSLHARDGQSPISAQFRGTIDDIAVSLEGDLGPVDALLQRRWPYPVSLQGNVNGQNASVSTQLRVEGKTASLDPLRITAGANSVTGQMAVSQSVPRSRVTFNLSAPVYVLGNLAPGGATDRAVAAVRAGADSFVFRDEPLPTALLTLLDADGELSIGQLILSEGGKIDNLHASIRLDHGRLELTNVQGSIYGGTASGRFVLDVGHRPAPELSLQLEAKALDLAAILTALGREGGVEGGKTDLALDLVATGMTPRQWASSMTGTASAVVGPATLINMHIDLDSPLNKLSAAANPFHKSDPSTELQCAVARFAIRNGVADVDHGMAFEAGKFGATATGMLDFRNETLDLAIRPRVKEGIPLSIPQVADLVSFRGPFRAPSVAIDSMATAATIARIGAAAYTGGLSLVGESLLSRAAGGGALCQAAMQRALDTSQRAAGDKKSLPTMKDAATAVGRILNR